MIRQNKSKVIASEMPTFSAERATFGLSLVFAFALGLGLLTVTGFAQSTHDLAHDSRHAFSFPCH